MIVDSLALISIILPSLQASATAQVQVFLSVFQVYKSSIATSSSASFLTGLRREWAELRTFHLAFCIMLGRTMVRKDLS